MMLVGLGSLAREWEIPAFLGPVASTTGLAVPIDKVGIFDLVFHNDTAAILGPVLLDASLTYLVDMVVCEGGLVAFPGLLSSKADETLLIDVVGMVGMVDLTCHKNTAAFLGQVLLDAGT